MSAMTRIPSWPFIWAFIVLLLAACSGPEPEEIDGIVTIPLAEGVLAVAAVGGNVWVTNFKDGTVTRLDRSGAVLSTTTVGSSAGRIIFAANSVWVSSFIDGLVVKLSPDGEVERKISLLGGPTALVFDGEHVWVGLNAKGSVVKLRPADGAVLAEYKAGGNPGSLAFDGRNLWVGDSIGDTVTVLDRDGNVVRELTVGRSVADMAFDGEHMWIASQQPASVSKVSLEGAVLGTFQVPGVPRFMTFDGDGVWVSSGSLNKLTLDGEPIREVPVGENPGGLLFDGGYLWVANTGDGTVMRVSPAKVLSSSIPTPGGGGTPDEPLIYTIDIPPFIIPNVDIQFLQIDASVRYQITDPRKFLQTLRNEVSAASTIGGIVAAVLRNEVGLSTLREITGERPSGIEEDRATVETFLTEDGTPARSAFVEAARAKTDAVVNAPENDFGIEIVDVGAIIRARSEN